LTEYSQPITTITRLFANTDSKIKKPMSLQASVNSEHKNDSNFTKS